jgi:hypothetical protein
VNGTSCVLIRQSDTPKEDEMNLKSGLLANIFSLNPEKNLVIDLSSLTRRYSYKIGLDVIPGFINY